MTDNKGAFRLQWLKNKIEELNTSYYAGEPEVTDAEFDALYLEMKELENTLGLKEEEKQSNVLGFVKSSTLDQQVHRRPMLSLRTETDSSIKGFYDFDTQVRRELMIPMGQKISYISEVKFDGIGLNLQYRQGILTTILTRGDGEVGENVTHAISLFGTSIVSDISKHYPHDIEIRGEAMITREDFQALNKELEITGQKLLSNPRNAVAGTIRVLDLEKIRNRKLIFFPYSLGEVSGPSLGLTHDEVIKKLFSWGFTLFNGGGYISTTEGNADNLPAWDFFKKTEVERKNLSIDIDGVVHKVNSLDLQEKLGFRTREPRWAVAQKFPPSGSVTKLYAIDVQVGRSGKLTPVGKVMPVNINGVIVSKATLHNLFDIRRRGVRVGDDVKIQRAGDVIPEIVYRVDLKPRDPYVANFKFPKTCPSCGSPVIRPKGEANYYCSGKNVCEEQIIGSLVHFASREAMDIKGLGEETIKTLVKNKILYTYLDIYTTPKDVYATTGEMGEKLASKLMIEIEKSKTNQPKQFLYGLGIRQVGAGTSRRLLKIVSLDILVLMCSSSSKFINEISNEGPVVGEQLYKYFSNERNLQRFRNFESLPGVKFQIKKVEVPKNEPLLSLNGLVIAVTGTLEKSGRSDFKEMIEMLGGTCSSNVTKKTWILIIGKNPTEHKVKEAQRLGILILKEEDFGIKFGRF